MTDEEQIIRLFEDGDRALIAGDAGAMRSIYTDDYVQYDEAGVASTREKMIEKLISGKMRLVSMKSTGRRVRILGEFAIVHGAEVDEVEQGGRLSTVRYLYMDVVVKRGGRWQIVGSQLVRP